MENASKALLMAAGVLIGMLVLSLAVYLIVSFGSTSAELHEKKAEQELQKFNSQFISYEGKDGLTIYDVVSVANLASENNKYYEFGNNGHTLSDSWSDYYILVQLKGSPIEHNTQRSTPKYDTLISSYLESDNMQELVDNPADPKYLALKQFTCKVEINQITGRVYKVIFNEKP